MAYIGKSIESGTFSVLDTSGNTYNGSNVTFNLGTQVGSPAQLLVSHDGVIQKPGTDYTLATGGTQITFSTAPASGASIFIVEISGAVGGPLDSDLNGTELILDADGDTSITADTDDQIDFKIAGADDLRMTANAINVLSGTTLTIDSGATITNSGTASGFGALAGIDDQSSSNDDQLTITDTAVVINEDSDDVDFRVEGNGVASLFHINAGDDRVGIAGDPDLGGAGSLHIKKSDSSSSSVNQYSDNIVIEEQEFPGMSFLSENSGAAQISFGDQDDDDVGFISYDHPNNFMNFRVNATEHFRIASDGTLTATDTSIGSNSDSRVKKNITNFTYDLAKFKQFQPKTFDWKNPTQHNNAGGNRGFVAQDIQAIDDYWVGEIEIKEGTLDYDLIPADENGVHKSLTSKLGKKDAMYISVINQLITRIEALEG